MHAIRIDRSKSLAEEPHCGHNRYHPDIAPVLEVGEGEEVVLETRDALDGQIKPGMTVAEVGTTPNVIGSDLLALVGTGGRVISAPVDKVGVTKLEPASVDAVAVLSTLPVVLEPKTMFETIAKAVKPGGVMLVVDVPQENDGKRVIGLEAEDVVKLATAAGFKREAESGIVPGHYAIRFRK